MEAWREEIHHSELYHHGILGMKWYVRNGPPYPLDYYAHNASERQAGWTNSINGYNRHMYGRNTAVGKRSVNYAGLPDRGYGGYSSRYRRGQGAINNLYALGGSSYGQGNSVSLKRYHDAWIRRHMRKGMTRTEAERAEAKRKKLRNAAMVVGAASIAAAAIIAKKKRYADYVDRIITPGTKLQNVSANPTRSIDGALYTSVSKADKFKYSGFYATQLRLGLVGDAPAKDIYRHYINVDSSIKLASNNSARKVLQEKIRTDKNYQKALLNHLRSKDLKLFTPTQYITRAAAIHDVKAGKMSMLGYHGFNASLVNQKSEASRQVVNSFYESMRKKGYDAIQDLNDSRLSGYHTKSANIIFNAANKVSVEKSVHQGAKKTYTKGAAAFSLILGQNAAYLSGVGAAAVIGTKAAHEKAKNDFVQKYRKEHPGTTLTASQIGDIYERQNVQKSDRIKKILGGAMVGAVAAGGIYAYVKYGRKHTDEIIKKGTTIQTLAADPDRINQGRQIYTNYMSKDIKSYEGAFGMTRKADLEKGASAFKARIRADVSRDVKVANRDVAEKEFYRMMKKDKEFNKTVTELITSKDLLKSDINKNYHYKGKYDKFNTMVLPLDDSTEIGKKAQPAIDKYYNKLKSKGYSAIEDAKDRRYSVSIRSKSAVMMFDRSSLKNIRVDSLDQDIVNAGKKIAEENTRQLKFEQLIKDTARSPKAIAAVGAVLGGTTVAAAGKITAEQKKNAVDNYRKEHPFSQLTDAQIAKMKLGGYTESEKKAIQRERDQNAVDKYREQHPGTTLSDAEIIAMLRKRKGG